VVEVLIIRDVALRLKLAERTVNAMLGDRELPGFKVRGQWRVRSDHFDQWLDLVGAGKAPEAATATVMASSDAGAAASAPAAAARLGETPASSPTITSSDRPEARIDDRGHGPDEEPSGMQLLSERVTQSELHRRFVAALGSRVQFHSRLDQKPLELDLSAPLPTRVRVYLFNATRPPGGRPTGEHKVQLIMPGQKRGERGQFDVTDSRVVLLAGYAAEEDVFVLWDAGLYPDFAWSRNVQVKAQTLLEASAGKLAQQQRRLRPGDGAAATETLLACPPMLLADAIRLRQDLTYTRLGEAS
jgi:excisionase family DNA binding protein